MLQTAAEQDSMLPGIARRAVLQAAEQLRMTVVEQAPNIRQAHLWREAFITSW